MKLQIGNDWKLGKIACTKIELGSTLLAGFLDRNFVGQTFVLKFSKFKLKIRDLFDGQNLAPHFQYSRLNSDCCRKPQGFKSPKEMTLKLIWNGISL